ncbi:MAG: InlB B-repeat-containing protein, partial [Lachnospiraceae bacterium]|nr:InlB B-repeat-containing protein [Lachnospiraceae bacterium]
DYALYVHGESVGRTTVAGTTAHFFAQWEADTFTVNYYSADDAEASTRTSTVTYGVSQKTLTISELGFSKSGSEFAGWKVYRDYDNKWYVKDANGSKYWATSVPAGGDYALYVNGESVGRTTVAGTTAHFYAQWKPASTFTIQYHVANNQASSPMTTTVTYGVSQKTLTIEELGFERNGQRFIGWTVYREYDGKWSVKNPDGSTFWGTQQFSGGTGFNLYVNGESVSRTAPAGTVVHMYAQWASPNKFLVKYYLTDNSSCSPKMTQVPYGTTTKTLTAQELGFSRDGKQFVGWKVYRDYDKKWYVKDANGNKYWATSVPAGGDYALYVDGENIAKTTVNGTTAYFYAQWR